MKVIILFLGLLVLAKSIPLDHTILPDIESDNYEHNNYEHNYYEHDDSTSYTITDVAIKEGNNECSTCLFFVRIISSIMNKNTSQEFIVEEATKECHNLPVKYVGYCDKVVELIPAVIKYLSEKETASNICEKINMCDDFTNHIVQEINCKICQNIVDETEYIKDNHITGSQIKTFLNDHCKLINNQLQENCNNMVDNIYKDIIDNISKNNDFTEICKEKFICI